MLMNIFLKNTILIKIKIINDIEMLVYENMVIKLTQYR